MIAELPHVMTPRCSPLYANREMAKEVAERLRRSHAVRTRVDHCNACGGWHIRHGGHIDAVNLRILELLSLGYRTREIVPVLKLTKDCINNRITEMMARFSALSRTHLTSIAITIGIITIGNADNYEEQDGIRK